MTINDVELLAVCHYGDCCQTLFRLRRFLVDPSGVAHMDITEMWMGMGVIKSLDLIISNAHHTAYKQYQDKRLCPVHEKMRARLIWRANQAQRCARRQSNPQILVKARQSIGVGDSTRLAPIRTLNDDTILALARYAVRQQL